MPRKVLILFFHPRYESSRANRLLLQHAASLDGVTTCDMYELYPDFNIDVEAEKQRVEAHDIIIWQHPFYWYNCPPLMKQWIDLVLEYGWAYGRGGTSIKGKWIMNVFSSGGTFEVYQKDGRNRFTYRELLSPFDQTAYLCGMEYLPPFIIPGANRVSDEEVHKMATNYEEILLFLQNGDVHLDKLKAVAHFNDIIHDTWQEAFYKTL
jgi:glutathione-regulated potassium-efflux system ancillary protein KefG